MHWATWVFFLFFLHFWLLTFSFISSPWCRALNSWVFPVHSNVLRTEILSFFRFTQTCFALKSWVFPVHSNVLRTEILSFSDSLKRASPGNLEFFRFTQTTFFVHRKNSRFPGSARFSFTGKTQDFRAQHIFRSPEKTQDFRAQHVFRSPKKLKISVLSTFFVHRKNSRIQCSGAMLTDKTKAHNQKCKKNRKKLRLLSAFVFRSLKNILRAQNGYKRTNFERFLFYAKNFHNRHI